jgi:DNA ligase-1
LILDYKGNRVNVGSGFDDATRQEIWNNRNDIIGRVVEVKYKEISKDKNDGLESLQFPIFVCLREKGKTVSYD